MKLDFDVAIIGAGVAGMTAAIYLKRAGINCCIIEKKMYGGQITLTPDIRNYPGFISVDGFSLANNIFSQVQELEIEYINKEVVKIISKDSYKEVILKDQKLCVRAIVIATGRTPKNLEINGIEKLIGRGISYCATCDGPLYKGETVVVVGGGSSAFEEALYLSSICKEVIILNRSDKLRAEKYYQEAIVTRKNISVKMNCSIKEFITKDGRLDKINIYNGTKVEMINARACFICIGYHPDTLTFKEVVKTDKNGYIVTDKNRRTKTPYIYAAGDVVKKDKFQIITAMNDGVIAADSCIKDLEKC